jgi:predicted ATPase
MARVLQAMPWGFMNKVSNKGHLAEELHITEFLSLHNLKYEVKQFNVITGDMGSGKSLLIRLLEFFEFIFTDLFVPLNESFMSNLEFDNFCKNTTSKFNDRFNLDEKPFDVSYKCSYKCSYKEIALDVRIYRNKNTENISMESEFLKQTLPEWKKYLQENRTKTPDGEKEGKLAIYNLLSEKFGGNYPIATTFVPAARATLAITELDKPTFWDYYLDKFNSLANFILDKNLNPKYENKIKDILKAKMKINERKIYLISDDGRKVSLANASSGQQEIFYILLLLSKLSTFVYSYGKQHYILIEEPEAHLFPLEQKLVMELICEIFNDNSKSKLPVKFFITTHSPYVLNTVNNMLAKGNMINNFPDEKDNVINDEELKNIPALYPEKVSAVFVKENGSVENILKLFGEEHLIDPDAINDISLILNKDSNSLENLKSKLKAKNKKPI